MTKKIYKLNLFHVSIVGLFAINASGFSYAATVPDSGIINQIANPNNVERPKDNIPLPTAKPLADEVDNKGPFYKVHTITITGNTVFSNEDLQNLIDPEIYKKPINLPRLKRASNVIARYYRENGYSFAIVKGAINKLSDNSIDVKLDVVEGNFGNIKAVGKKNLGKEGQPFLQNLKPGDPIKDAELERSILLLRDQPGIIPIPIIRPSEEKGAGDLEVRVERDRYYDGEIGLDNYGERYTGRGRVHANLDINGPFGFGDQLTLQAIASDGFFRSAYVAYNAPLDATGWRGSVSYSDVSYQLGKELTSQGDTGYAHVPAAQLSYAWIRSQKENIYFDLGLVYKILDDNYSSTSTLTSATGASLAGQTQKRTDRSIPFTVRFDNRDSFYYGGITYGNVVVTAGNVSLNSPLAGNVINTAETAGNFYKFNTQIVREQNLPKDFLLYAKFAGQWTNNNLDSAEQFVISGPPGVRGYPVGAGFGDRGMLGRLELRYAVNDFTPYVFADAGRVTQSVHPVPGLVGANILTYSGQGLGVRYHVEHWKADVSVSWRNLGGAPASDPYYDSTPLVWASGAYIF